MFYAVVRDGTRLLTPPPAHTQMAALEVYIRRSYLAYNLKSVNVRQMLKGRYATADWLFFMPVWHPSLQRIHQKKGAPVSPTSVSCCACLCEWLKVLTLVLHGDTRVQGAVEEGREPVGRHAFAR